VSRRRAERWLPLCLSLAFTALAATSLFQNSAVWDEYYLGAGVDLSRPEGLFHPPLSYVLHGIPFLWWDVPDEVWAEDHKLRRLSKLVELRSDDWMLNASRLALLPMGIALGWIAFAWARQLYGFWAGVLTMTLVCFDPNVIAHAGLITPDVTLAATALFFAWRLWRLVEEPGWRNRLLAGLGLGLMLLSKYTALLLAPLLLAGDGVFRLVRAPGAPAALCRALRDWLAVGSLGVLVLWAGYGFDAGWIVMPSGLELPMIARRFVSGATFQLHQSKTPHDFWLMGEHSTRGWWYFYLVVLAIKVPLATLALLGARLAGGRRLGLRFDARELCLWLPPALLLAYLSLFNTIHNGIRYLLPVYPLALIALGRLALPAARSRRGRGALAAAAAWVVGASLFAWPHYLSYCNELIGGPRNGYLWLSDSNLDWGQDLKGLRRWMDEQGVDRIQLAYFGTADPAHYGIDYVYLPSPVSHLEPTPPLAPGEAPPRIVALSAYQYQGVARSQGDPYAVFRRYEPNARVGHSILIFDLDRLIPRD